MDLYARQLRRVANSRSRFEQMRAEPTKLRDSKLGWRLDSMRPKYRHRSLPPPEFHSDSMRVQFQDCRSARLPAASQRWKQPAAIPRRRYHSDFGRVRLVSTQPGQESPRKSTRMYAR